MEKVIQIQRLLLRSRQLPVFLICSTIAVLAGAVLLTTLQVREKIREQIAGRDGAVLYAVALLEFEDEAGAGLGDFAGEPASQVSVLLKTSQLKGVMGARLFDAAGGFVQAFPPEVLEGQLSPSDLANLKALKPVCRFHRAARLSELFIPDLPSGQKPDPVIPVLEVNVPFHARPAGPLAGVAQFLIEGQSIVAEFARLDRHLALQGLTAFAAGSGLLVAAIGLAFRRLRHAHRLVEERTEDLLKANQELALAAKTSALGTVTAHLIHGLKNPLAGLQSFVAGQQNPASHTEASDWQQAAASTQRMQTMVNEVVGLLREDETSVHYEVTLRELAEIVAARVESEARQRKVDFAMQFTTDGVLPNRVANLVGLILVNLTQNALEATPSGKAVCLSAVCRNDSLIFEVKDQGPGFAPTWTLFAPCRSTKEGGSGLGLALCKQLANHLGAELVLKNNTSAGCIFSLSLPGVFCAERVHAPLING